MRCAKFEDWIQKKLDGELEAGQQVPLEEHLKTCERCRRALADYEGLARMLKATAPAECEPLAASVLERIEAERPRRVRLAFRFALTVAAAVVFSFVLLAVVRRARTPHEPAVAREETQKGVEVPSLSELLAMEPPSVLDDSTQILAENLETLKKDADTAGKTILDVFEEIQRGIPLI
ncbi:MAG: zf-HC2 domain-containing protein [Planctomycetota bacterium]